MNHTYTFILIIVFVTFIQSCKNIDTKISDNFQKPTENTKGLLVLNARACYFDDVDSIEKKTAIKIDLPSERELEQVASIMDYTGLPQNFKIYRGDIDNALATMFNGQRLIIYNKDLFTTMDVVDSSYWSSMFILAHEIGHHLAYNISDTSNALNAELEADKFAGFILYKMGADSNQVVDAVASNLISTTQDSKTHPAKEKRIEAVKKSWQQSSFLRYLSATPPIIKDHFSQAVGKYFDDDVDRNNLNGYPTAYNPTGYNDYQLINNNWALSKMDSGKAYSYSHSRNSDNTIYEVFPAVSRKYQGIIVDVQKKISPPEFKDFVFLVVGILITKTDEKYNYAALSVNHRYQFLVCFLPAGFTQDAISYYNFFAGGRRLEFDIIDLNKRNETWNLYNISRAYSL